MIWKRKFIFILNNNKEREYIAANGHKQAMRYTQKQMIEILSNEINYFANHRNKEYKRFFRWFVGWLGNQKIALVDKIAAMKNKISSS